MKNIESVWQSVRFGLSILGGWFSFFVGGANGLLIALLIFMALDYVSGVMCAIVDKKLSSSVGFKGLFKKMLILMLVGVANIIDVYVIGNGSTVRGIVIVFYLSNEGISLLENAAHIGIPIPEKLREILSQLHDHEDGAK